MSKRPTPPVWYRWSLVTAQFLALASAVVALGLVAGGVPTADAPGALWPDQSPYAPLWTPVLWVGAPSAFVMLVLTFLPPRHQLKRDAFFVTIGGLALGAFVLVGWMNRMADREHQSVASEAAALGQMATAPQSCSALAAFVTRNYEKTLRQAPAAERAFLVRAGLEQLRVQRCDGVSGDVIQARLEARENLARDNARVERFLPVRNGKEWESAFAREERAWEAGAAAIRRAREGPVSRE